MQINIPTGVRRIVVEFADRPDTVIELIAEPYYLDLDLHEFTSRSCPLYANTRSKLTSNGIHTVRELAEHTATDLMNIPKFQLADLSDVQQFLAIHGLELKAEASEDPDQGDPSPTPVEQRLAEDYIEVLTHAEKREGHN